MEEVVGKQQQSKSKEIDRVEKIRVFAKENNETKSTPGRMISNEIVSNSKSDSNAKIMAGLSKGNHYFCSLCEM